MARARAAAEYCAGALGWRRIECTEMKDGVREMLPVETIHQRILQELQDLL